MEELERDGADMRKMKNATGKLEFARMDQDVLNATIMATDVPLCLLGSEAMGDVSVCRRGRAAGDVAGEAVEPELYC